MMIMGIVEYPSNIYMQSTKIMRTILPVYHPPTPSVLQGEEYTVEVVQESISLVESTPSPDPAISFDHSIHRVSTPKTQRQWSLHTSTLQPEKSTRTMLQ